MEILRAGKLHSYVGPDNFLYVRNWVRPNGVEYYKCRKKTCAGRAIVKNGKDFRRTAAHNHELDLEEVQRLKFKHKLQQRAAEEPIAISEIYKQEASMVEGMTVQKFKSINKMMYRARAMEYPPHPKTITELGTSLADERWKDKLVYAYGEEKEEFFKTCLESEDGSTQIIFMSPTFEDFARSGAPLRLHMDAAFKLKPACGEGSQYVVIHMYIGTISYPFIHMFTNIKSYFSYVSLLKYMKQLIPQINVEIFVSNDQESVEAAYAVYPKAVKSYYQVEEKDGKKEKDLTDLEIYNKELTKQVGRPRPGIWRFIEVLKDIDYHRMCDYYKLRNKRPPKRYPKKLCDAETQVDFNSKNSVKVNAVVQTVPPTNITEYFSEYQPDLSSSFNRSIQSFNNGTPVVNKFKNFTLPSVSSTPKRKPILSDIRKTSHTIIVKTPKRINDENVSPSQDSTEEVIPLNLNDIEISNDNLQLEVILDPNDFPNKKIPSSVESTATEALKIFKALKMEKIKNNKSNKKIIILNPKSLLRSSKNKIVKITKMKPVKADRDLTEKSLIMETKDSGKTVIEDSVTIKKEIFIEDLNSLQIGDSRFLDSEGGEGSVLLDESQLTNLSNVEDSSQIIENEEAEDIKVIQSEIPDEEMIEDKMVDRREMVMHQGIQVKGKEMVISEAMELKGEEVILEIIDEQNRSMEILPEDHDYSNT